jgi:hypothetical protein
MDYELQNETLDITLALIDAMDSDTADIDSDVETDSNTAGAL